MTDLREGGCSFQRTVETAEERDKQIMRTLERVLLVQKDVRLLIDGIRESVDAVLLRQMDDDGKGPEGETDEDSPSIEDEEYEAGVVDPPKTDPAKSQWRDLAAAFNAAANLSNDAEGKKVAKKISAWYIKRATVSCKDKGKREREFFHDFGLPLAVAHYMFNVLIIIFSNLIAN